MFPAHAGMNRVGSLPIPVALHVPRTRGDEPFSDYANSDPWDVPRTRGDEPKLPPWGTDRRHVPRTRGMNRPSRPAPQGYGYVPRTRGDEPVVGAVIGPAN